MTEEELQEIEKYHVPMTHAFYVDQSTGAKIPVCETCDENVEYGDKWPCLPIRLVQEIRRLQRSASAWEETAARHCYNEFYWRFRSQAAEDLLSKELRDAAYEDAVGQYERWMKGQ